MNKTIGSGVETGQALRPGHGNPMVDITNGILVPKGEEVTANGYPLIKLGQVRSGQDVVQLRLPYQDDLAKELIAQTGYYIGVGLANLINIFNPERIVIGGGLSNIGDVLLTPAFKVAGERAFKEAYRAVCFAFAGLGRDSGVLGAAAFALHEINKAASRL